MNNLERNGVNSSLVSFMAVLRVRCFYALFSNGSRTTKTEVGQSRQTQIPCEDWVPFTYDGNASANIRSGELPQRKCWPKRSRMETFPFFVLVLRQFKRTLHMLALSNSDTSISLNAISQSKLEE